MTLSATSIWFECAQCWRCVDRIVPTRRSPTESVRQWRSSSSCHSHWDHGASGQSTPAQVILVGINAEFAGLTRGAGYSLET